MFYAPSLVFNSSGSSATIRCASIGNEAPKYSAESHVVTFVTRGAKIGSIKDC